MLVNDSINFVCTYTVPPPTYLDPEHILWGEGGGVEHNQISDPLIKNQISDPYYGGVKRDHISYIKPPN